MAKRIPQLRNIGWDITINDKNDVVLIEANGYAPGVDVQQAADGIGRRHLYTPLIEEIRNYKREQMKFLGWRVNNFINFRPAYDAGIPLHDTRLKLAMDNLVPDCASVMDVGCRQAKFAKSVCLAHVKYYPVDFKAYDEEIIACDFNDDFPDIKVDTCLCAYTSEFVEFLSAVFGEHVQRRAKTNFDVVPPRRQRNFSRLQMELSVLDGFHGGIFNQDAGAKSFPNEHAISVANRSFGDSV